MMSPLAMILSESLIKPNPTEQGKSQESRKHDVDLKYSISNRGLISEIQSEVFSQSEDQEKIANW